MDGGVEECVDPGGNEAILNVGEGRGPGPPGRGGKRTVGIRQWRRLDVQDAGELEGRARQTQNQPYAQSTCILCVICALICYIPDSCNHEPYLTVSICFRRINHMAVKNHLHSSSGVREVVSGTSRYPCV
jgi:hypothetical protein